MKQQISATIIKDSIERVGNNRITTFKLTYPRMIHAELLTHSMLKSNSASSRAIPFKRMVEMVENDPFIPIRWMREHKGMQGTEYVTDEIEIENCKSLWLVARNHATEDARRLCDVSNITKQICNRLLEPFLWHTIILTGTEFENFFALRCHPMAEIHLQDLAYKMLNALNEGTPQELKPGEWHIPYEEDIEDNILLSKSLYGFEEKSSFEDEPSGWVLEDGEEEYYKKLQELKIKVSTAISAQISYLKFGSNDYKDLLDLHDCLLTRPYIGKRGVLTKEDPIHASPASHCAQAMTEEEYMDMVKGYRTSNNTQRWRDNPSNGWCHNLKGFKSYRSMLPNENSKDSRLLKK